VDGPARPVSPYNIERVVIVGPFLFDGPAQTGLFFMGHRYTGPKRAGWPSLPPLLTPTCSFHSVHFAKTALSLTLFFFSNRALLGFGPVLRQVS